MIAFVIVFDLFRYLGGNLGWDPVLTTCILGKILERIRTSHETQHGNHWVDHEKNCEAIYWKHHTSHHLTKISHTISFKTFFFTKIPFLLKTSKIPYYSTEDDILWYFITPLIIFPSSHHHLVRNTCSVYRIPPQNTPRKTQTSNRKNALWS